MRLFDVSQPVPTTRGSLLDVLLGHAPEGSERADQVLAEAVAVADQIAAQANRRRVVVWGTRMAPQQWGGFVDASNPDRLHRAWLDLVAALGRQRIAWVSGRHLLDDIDVSVPPGGPRLAGR